MDRRFPLVALVLAAFAAAQEHHIPEQPVQFSHKLHVALPLKCRECHTNPNPGKAEGLPSASKCMACHFSIAKDQPEIRKLKNYADQKQEIPWAPVYEVPDFVKFGHRAHVRFSCEKCHGPVETREALWRETDMSMAGCVACHRQNRASTRCRVCHEDRR
jgi:Class III cytochrome C family/Cytochrome c7 and related cytochrome c